MDSVLKKARTISVKVSTEVGEVLGRSRPGSCPPPATRGDGGSAALRRSTTGWLTRPSRGRPASFWKACTAKVVLRRRPRRRGRRPTAARRDQLRVRARARPDPRRRDLVAAGMGWLSAAWPCWVGSGSSSTPEPTPLTTNRSWASSRGHSRPTSGPWPRAEQAPEQTPSAAVRRGKLSTCHRRSLTRPVVATNPSGHGVSTSRRVTPRAQRSAVAHQVLLLISVARC